MATPNHSLIETLRILGALQGSCELWESLAAKAFPIPRARN